MDNPPSVRLIIAGGRDHALTDAAYALLDALPIAAVVSGAARGVDAAGEDYARIRGIPITRYPADWRAHGRAAGPIRNAIMAEHADALAAFPGGRGTADMIRQARRRGLTIHDFTGRPETVLKVVG